MDTLCLWTLLLLCLVFHLTLSSDIRKLRRVFIIDEKVNWEISNKTCREMNAHLVTVNNDDDVKYIRRKMGRNVSSTYLGLQNQKNESQSEWSNGEQIMYQPMPRNLTNKQRCETIHKNEWRAFACDEAKYFMCYNPSTVAAYMLIEEEKKWCEARQYCRKHYTDLVSIHNDTQNEAVIYAGANKTFWIGMKHDPYTWADGQCSTFSNFQNADNSSNKECATLSRGQNVTLDSCNNEKEVICMQGNARVSPPTEPLTWEEAYNHCKEDHSGLLYIQNKEDQQEVETWLNVTEEDSGPFWIGLRQSRLFGFWIWSTIDRVVEYHNWKNNLSPAVPLSHHCGVMEAGTWKWRDEDCNTKLRALCMEDMYP